MRVAIATVQTMFVRGGAELHAAELAKQLQARGHEVEVVWIPFQSYPADRIPDHILSCRLLDISASCERMIGLKFPAYLMRHPDKVLWLLHQYRPAYDLWSHPRAGELQHQKEGAQIRDAVQRADTTLIPEFQTRFTTSANVAARLRKYNGIDAAPLYHPPPRADLLRMAGAGDYLFFPSRLNPLKRQMLILDALTKTKHPVKVWFSGAADDPAVELQYHALSQSHGLQDRVRWLGLVSDERVADLYARCLAVIFPPLNEDYGYITLEAMLSGKPVVTCTDSGGPLEFVVPGKTGLIAEPTPESCAAAMDQLWEDRAAAKQMGQAARDQYTTMKIGWDNVIRKLLA